MFIMIFWREVDVYYNWVMNIPIIYMVYWACFNLKVNNINFQSKFYKKYKVQSLQVFFRDVYYDFFEGMFIMISKY